MIDPAFLSLFHRRADSPAHAGNWALFLDLDGTLIDIARTPDEVTVPRNLVKHLAAASVELGGAVAIVSGRTLADIDRLLAPLKLVAAAEHGAVIRFPDGSREELEGRVPVEWVQALFDAAGRMDGVLIERKAHSIAVHYRKAPHHADELTAIVDALVARNSEAFAVLRAKMALEIRPRAASKARVVKRLMKLAPFEGRTPVFVGDDVTDREGFAAAEAFGGAGFDVEAHFDGRPTQVRAWLRSLAHA